MTLQGKYAPPLMGVSAARLHGAISRALATATVATPAQHRPIVLSDRTAIVRFVKRNTRVIDIVRELAEYEIEVDVHEPWADPAEAQAEYGVAPVATLEAGAYDAIVVAVAHNEFKEMGVDAIRALGKPDAVLYDVKAMFPQGAADLRL